MKDIFISYAHEDLDKAMEICSFLERNGFSVWLDKKNLLPGIDWKIKIEKAIQECEIFIACLSANSINKRGYVQSELKKALEVLSTIPEEDIFLIPVRLDDCLVPSTLQRLHWLDFFKDGSKEQLIKSIRYQFGVPDEAPMGEDKRIIRLRLNSSQLMMIAKKALYGPQEGRCFYCNNILRGDLTHIDHFFPVTVGGMRLLWNLVLVDPNCNVRKADWLPNPEHIERLIALHEKVVEKGDDASKLLVEQLGRTSTERKNYISNFYKKILEQSSAAGQKPRIFESENL